LSPAGLALRVGISVNIATRHALTGHKITRRLDEGDSTNPPSSTGADFLPQSKTEHRAGFDNCRIEEDWNVFQTNWVANNAYPHR